LTQAMSPGELEAALRQIGATRYHNLHPLHRLMHEGRCTRIQLQAWALNRYYYQAWIPIKDSTILSRIEDPALRGHAFNFSNEIQITVLDLVQRISRLMKSELQPVVLNQATNEIRHQYLSAEKARRMLGWSPLFTLDRGLQATVQWYERFLQNEH